jgi:hypothetical protein
MRAACRVRSLRRAGEEEAGCCARSCCPPDGDVIGVLMSAGASQAQRGGEHTAARSKMTRVSVDPEDDSGGMRAQDALQRADSDTVITPQRDGNSSGGRFPAPHCEPRA